MAKRKRSTRSGPPSLPGAPEWCRYLRPGLSIGIFWLIVASGVAACALQQPPTPLPSAMPAAPTATQVVTPAPLTPLPSATPLTPELFTFRVVNTYPHDPGAYTQGLLFDDGVLYEGTGLRGQSTLRRVDLLSGEVVQSMALDPEFFGEGIAILGDRIVQLTLTSGLGFVYDRQSFELIDEFEYTPEGWGLTYDGNQLIMSEGTAELRFLDPESFQESSRLSVADMGVPVLRLNELEWVEGEIYANVWQSDMIARISPSSGEVLGWIDLSGLRGNDGPTGVLNGIAYDAEGRRLFVTGKNWPELFEIELIREAD